MRTLIKSIVFGLLALNCFNNCNAQVFGFLGKRYSINLNTYTSPNINRNDITSINSDNTGFFAFNNRFSLGVDYVLTNKWSVSGELHLFSTATQNLAFDNSLENENSKFKYRVLSNSFSLKFKRFLTRKSDFIAPVGKYFSLGVMATQYSLKDTEGNIFLENTKLSTGNMHGIIIGLGRKRVFFKQIIVDYGIEACYYLIRPEGEEDPTDRFAEMITVPQKRVRNASFLIFKLGVGYLL